MFVWCQHHSSWISGLEVGRGPTNVSVAGCVEHVEAFALGSGVELGLTCSRWDRRIHIGLDMTELGLMCADILLCTGAQVGSDLSKRVVNVSWGRLMNGRSPHVPRGSPTPWVSPRISPQLICPPKIL